MVQTEGYAALMRGVSATVARGLFYGGGHLVKSHFTLLAKKYLWYHSVLHPAFNKRGSAWLLFSVFKSTDESGAYV